MTGETVLDTALVPKNSRIIERWGRSLLARTAAAGLLALGGGVTVQTYEAPPAQAATTFANDYPDMDAVDCAGSYGIYSWCKGSPSVPGSARGFDYRNCTDGASYWVGKYTNVSIPSGWSDAKNWNTNAASSYTVYAGNTTNVEPGDIAQDDTGTYGHVGFVTDVSKNTDGSVASITVAELNKDAMGDYSHDTYTAKDASGNFKRNGAGKTWDHFIDVNGVGKGLNNETIGSGGSTTNILKEPSTIVDPATGRNIFYVGADNNIWQWSVVNGHWTNTKLVGAGSAAGEAVNPGTSPSAVEDSSTGRNVFYTGADRRVWQWSVQNGNWVNNLVGGNVADSSSPSAIVDPATGRNIFFTSADGSIRQLSVQSGGWYENNLGGAALGGTSPSAVEDSATGRNVFYVGLDDKISQFSIQNGAWANVALNGTGGNETVAGGTSPSAIADSATGRNVFYAGTDNKIYQWSVQNGAWNNFQLTGTGGNQLVSAGSSPSAVADPSTGRNIFYTGADNKIYQWSVQNGTWNNFQLSGTGGSTAVDAKTSPGAVVDSSTGRNIFYFSNGQVWQWSVQNGAWNNFFMQ